MLTVAPVGRRLSRGARARERIFLTQTRTPRDLKKIIIIYINVIKRRRTRVQCAAVVLLWRRRPFIRYNTACRKSSNEIRIPRCENRREYYKYMASANDVGISRIFRLYVRRKLSNISRRKTLKNKLRTYSGYRGNGYNDWQRTLKINDFNNNPLYSTST